MLATWAPAAVFLLLSFAAPLAMIGLAALLRVRGRQSSEAAADTYECGEEPDGAAWVRFHPRYYLVALVFVVFDVEIVFLVPWALRVGDSGPAVLAEMVVFVAILLLGWVYAVRKGALRWQ